MGYQRRTIHSAPRIVSQTAANWIDGSPARAAFPLIKLIILASFCQTCNLNSYHRFIQSRHQGLEAQIFAVTGRAVHYRSIASKCLASRRQDSCEFLRPFGRRGQRPETARKGTWQKRRVGLPAQQVRVDLVACAAQQASKDRLPTRFGAATVEGPFF
jgi:hypothetical protein